MLHVCPSPPHDPASNRASSTSLTMAPTDRPRYRSDIPRSFSHHRATLLAARSSSNNASYLQQTIEQVDSIKPRHTHNISLSPDSFRMKAKYRISMGFRVISTS
ncbi:hypothetical protein Scep_025727 [Stephania cephalantha]|uniref:Uncharacterized protein n=1 Tax=Stephania cephalantha TaxID=152367 RepID=A0AAP0HMK0_9MAGN